MERTTATNQSRDDREVRIYPRFYSSFEHHWKSLNFLLATLGVIRPTVALRTGFSGKTMRKFCGMAINNSTLFVMIAMMTAMGCDEASPPVSSSPPAENAEPAADTTPEETVIDAPAPPREVAVWVQSDIQDGDFLLALGYLGESSNGGASVKPAVQILKDDEDVGDAVVRVSLVAEDGEVILVEEQQAAFDAGSEEETARYVSAELAIPEDAKKFLIRFRIKFPEVDTESSYDIPQEVSK